MPSRLRQVSSSRDLQHYLAVTVQDGAISLCESHGTYHKSRLHTSDLYSTAEDTTEATGALFKFV